MTSKEALDKIKHIDIDGRYPYPNFLKDDVRYKESIEVIEKRLNELEKRYTPMKVIKTPQERLLELGFITTDETNYSITYLFNGLEIIIFKKEKTYQTYVHGDNYKPINLKLAEVLVDYLKELENE